MRMMRPGGYLWRTGWLAQPALSLTLAATVLLGVGCASVDPATQASSDEEPPTASIPKVKTLPEEPRVERDNSPRGVVLQVNRELRFLVIDFAATQMPRFQDRLGLYRQGRWVGEVLVTGPTKGTTVAGDLVRGEARPGDIVRLE